MHVRRELDHTFKCQTGALVSSSRPALRVPAPWAAAWHPLNASSLGRRDRRGVATGARRPARAARPSCRPGMDAWTHACTQPVRGQISAGSRRLAPCLSTSAPGRHDVDDVHSTTDYVGIPTVPLVQQTYSASACSTQSRVSTAAVR